MIKIEDYFPRFGVNKKREIERLIFEISKKEKISPCKLLLSIKDFDYEKAKLALLKKRYSKTFRDYPDIALSSFYLPQYKIDKNLQAATNPSQFYPKRIYHTSKARLTKTFENAKNLFPFSNFIEIESLKSFQKGKNFNIKNYNERLQNLFLIDEQYDFFKKCPCTSNAVGCGYSIMNIGMGCLYECAYCFLQGYQNISGIVIPCNIDDYLTDEKILSLQNVKTFFNYKRIGSGEFTDSLVFDNITGFSKEIVEFFKNKKEIYFEFKTKSVNIENLIEAGGTKNIVCAWSLNSIQMQKENEFKTPSILERLNAAKKIVEAGFSVAFHFDPIIFYENWRGGYKEVVDMLFDIIPQESIKWISLGSLRMPAELKKTIENRFPENKIMDEEFLLGKDYKLRYADNIRIEMFDYMNKIIKSKKSKAIVYLCMEDKSIWETTFKV
ncbi:MAG: hypothetical protein LBQ37_04140 [Elusimicrobiota bacterium]|nr:hypothetical protein [Elusimicrobiota bacterium]